MNKPAQFTQGPWVVDEDYEDEEQQAIGIVKEGHGYIAGIHILASCNNGEGFTAEDRANAHLIAAAPAMYREIMDLLDTIRHMQHYYNGPQLSQHDLQDIITKGVNVLAQAEGRHHE